MSFALLLPTVLADAAKAAGPLVKKPGEDLYAALRSYTAPKFFGSGGETTKFYFRDQDGKPITVDQLKEQFKEKFLTTSFGFAGCDKFCPSINGALEAMHEKKPDLAMLVIAVQPETDGATAQSRNYFLEHLHAMIGSDANIRIIYPTDSEGNLSNAMAPTLQKSFGYPAHNTDATNHTPSIALYNGNNSSLIHKSEAVIADTTNSKSPEETTAAIKAAAQQTIAVWQKVLDDPKTSLPPAKKPSPQR